MIERASRLAAFVLGLLVALGGESGMAPTQAADNDLGTLRWDYRPVVIFAPTADHSSLREQLAMLRAARRGIEDRRIAVYAVTRSGVSAILGAPEGIDGADQLRERFNVPEDTFKVVLIGLDGGQKLSADDPVVTDRLFSVIDAMPMRQRELRARE